MIARFWFFVVGVLVGGAAATFWLMRHYKVQFVPTAAPPQTSPAPARPAAGVNSTNSPPPSPTGALPTVVPIPQPQPGPASTDTALLLPVLGVQPAELIDTFYQTRGGARIHEALDIMAPRGREVVAVADGKVVKLFNSQQGGLTVYQFDPTERYAYYYAHLDRYAAGLNEGRVLKRGELIGYVGSTGNADPAAPHLHFAIFELGPEKRWWEGRPVNPYPLLRGPVSTN